LAEAEKHFTLRELPALQTVGYSELFAMMEGKHDMVEAIRLIKRNTRRYAKRQLTWFKNQADYQWFHPGHYEHIRAYADSNI
ncbi:MAG: tRNA (adenosine(37)-N6)-dimethylallyltransferase MiaA, partial [Cyclobacteriaceae bacterium]|nr:tRNA (adenosine(37)-N6)-dimethylallyltransferase MiaA [Cyclobacteriaceae bacterium]